ncbi:MAG: sulfur carrier protein ThiS [Polyangiaceae bacterium]|nr:sulfur carrier protein ThiS [Polyangiaceae bacterium]
MKVTLNGRDAEVPEELTLAALVSHLGLAGGPVAIERNGEVVPRKEHGDTRVEAGDRLEIVHFVGGG